jgi:hypothetical protein
MDTVAGVINIHWDEVAGAAGYRLYRSLTNDFSNILIPVGTVAAPATNLTNIPDSSTSWYYFISAYNASGAESWWGPAASAVYSDVYYSTEVKVSFNNVATFSWSHRKITNITLYWASNNGLIHGPLSISSNYGTTTWDWSGLSLGNTYNIYTRFVDTDGQVKTNSNTFSTFPSDSYLAAALRPISPIAIQGVITCTNVTNLVLRNLTSGTSLTQVNDSPVLNRIVITNTALSSASSYIHELIAVFNNGLIFTNYMRYTNTTFSSLLTYGNVISPYYGETNCIISNYFSGITNLVYNLGGTVTSIPISKDGTNIFTVGGLTPNAAYNLQIQYYPWNSSTPFTSDLSFSTLVPSPTGIRLVADTNNGTATLSWAGASISSYVVVRSENHGSFVPVEKTNRTEYKDSDIKAGKHYTWRIYSVNYRGATNTYAESGINEISLRTDGMYAGLEGLAEKRLFVVNRWTDNQLWLTEGITFEPEADYLWIDIYRPDGNPVFSTQGVLPSIYTETWNGRGNGGGVLDTGIYLVRLRPNAGEAVYRIILLVRNY